MSNCCPICHHEDKQPFFEIDQLPTFIGVQWPSPEAARTCRRGAIRLVYCPGCGFIWNDRFDAKLLEYGQAYDNSLDFSPVFQQFARALAERLIETYDIRGKDVVELGCGKGHFLSLICEIGNNRGVGFDPSYQGERITHPAAGRVTYIQDFYGEKYTHHPGDLICCRHVFEHIDDPVGFLSMVRRTLGDRPEAIVYFEVPNARFILERLSVWDIIYEHCNYFSRESLATVFQREGFEVLRVAETYGGQFLGLEARLAPPAAPAAGRPDLTELTRAVAGFSEQMQARQAAWQARFADYRAKGKCVVVWGGGAKAVSFLNGLDLAGDEVRCVVDINPHKQGKFVPGTGQPIVAPESLKELQPEVAVLMNPIYRQEVAAELEKMGLTVELIEA